VILIILSIVLVSTILVATIGLTYQSFMISNTVNVSGNGVEVYPSSLNWGILGPSQSVYRNVLITNTGNLAEKLTMNTTGLPPFAVFSWNCTDYNLGPYSTVNAVFNLTVSNAPIGNFSFNTTVYGIA
jgi:hypothetical protein